MGLARSKRLRRWSAAALLISTFGIGQTMIGATPAQARCAGVNQLVYSTLNSGINGATSVTEEPTAGTCNNDYYYSDTFTAGTSGWRPSVWIQNGGVWTGYVGTGCDRFIWPHCDALIWPHLWFRPVVVTA